MEKCLILNENLHQNVREILKIQMDIFHYESIMILRVDEDGTCTPLLQSDDNKYESFTVEYEIDDASVNYIFKNPKQVIFDTITQQITDTSTTLLYDINDTLEIGTGYYIRR